MKIIAEAMALVDSARAEHIPIRLLGSVAVLYYAGQSEPRRPYHVKDIDLITGSEWRRQAQEFLCNRGWRICTELLMMSEMRVTFTRVETEYTLDLYYDEIDGNHTISLRDRLDISYPAISLTDLLLTKLQRSEMRPSDIWDVCALLRTAGDDSIDRARLEVVLGKDWGLCTTFTDNLNRLSSSFPMCASSVLALKEAALHCHKTWRWRTRALLGRRVRWWKETYEAAISTPMEGL